jgi:hypothetical protein
MLLDEAIDTSEIEDFRKEQDSLRQAIDENRKRFRFKENLAIGFSEFLFKEFDYSKAKAFSSKKIIFKSYITRKISFVVSGKELRDFFKQDILLFSKAKSREIKYMNFKPHVFDNIKEIKDLTSSSVEPSEKLFKKGYHNYREYSYNPYEAHLLERGIADLTITDINLYNGHGIALEELKKGYVENRNKLPVFLNDEINYLITFVDVRGIKENFVVSEVSEILSNEVNRTKKDIDLDITIDEMISKFV